MKVHTWRLNSTPRCMRAHSFLNSLHVSCPKTMVRPHYGSWGIDCASPVLQITSGWLSGLASPECMCLGLHSFAPRVVRRSPELLLYFIHTVLSSARRQLKIRASGEDTYDPKLYWIWLDFLNRFYSMYSKSPVTSSWLPTSGLSAPSSYEEARASCKDMLALMRSHLKTVANNATKPMKPAHKAWPFV